MVRAYAQVAGTDTGRVITGMEDKCIRRNGAFGKFIRETGCPSGMTRNPEDAISI